MKKPTWANSSLIGAGLGITYYDLIGRSFGIKGIIPSLSFGIRNGIGL